MAVLMVVIVLAGGQMFAGGGRCPGEAGIVASVGAELVDIAAAEAVLALGNGATIDGGTAVLRKGKANIIFATAYSGVHEQQKQLTVVYGGGICMLPTSSIFASSRSRSSRS